MTILIIFIVGALLMLIVIVGAAMATMKEEMKMGSRWRMPRGSNGDDRSDGFDSMLGPDTPHHGHGHHLHHDSGGHHGGDAGGHSGGFDGGGHGGGHH